MLIKFKYIVFSLLCISIFNVLSDNTKVFAQNSIQSIFVSLTDTIVCPSDSVLVTIEMPGVSFGSFTYSFNHLEYTKALLNGQRSFHLKEPGNFIINSYQEQDELGNILSQTDTIIPFAIKTFFLPTASLVGGGNYCEGDIIVPLSVSFTGEAPWLLSYTRNNLAPVSESFNTNNIVLADSAGTIINLISVSDKNNCATISLDGSGLLEIEDAPVAVIRGDSAFCPEAKATYSGTYNANYNYYWNIPSGAAFNQSGINEPSIEVQWIVSGTHTVSLTVQTINTTCSSAPVTKKILVKDLPNVKDNYDTIVCFDDNNIVSLFASGIEENTVYWPDFNYTGNSLEIDQEGTYSYIETISFGCSDTGEIRVVEKCIPEVFVPEAFTPNGDNINDVLEVFGIYVNLKLFIYSQTGEIVYKMFPGSPPWDGLINGKQAMNGVYYWKAYFTNKVGTEYSSEGHVTLLR
jgi:gliding motility-associated-like protein